MKGIKYIVMPFEFEIDDGPIYTIVEAITKELANKGYTARYVEPTSEIDEPRESIRFLISEQNNHLGLLDIKPMTINCDVVVDSHYCDNELILELIKISNDVLSSLPEERKAWIKNIENVESMYNIAKYNMRDFL